MLASFPSSYFKFFGSYSPLGNKRGEMIFRHSLAFVDANVHDLQDEHASHRIGLSITLDSDALDEMEQQFQAHLLDAVRQSFVIDVPSEKVNRQCHQPHI